MQLRKGAGVPPPQLSSDACPLCQTLTRCRDAVSTVDRLSVSDGGVQVFHHRGAQTLSTGEGHAPTAAAANALSPHVKIGGAHGADCLCHGRFAVCSGILQGQGAGVNLPRRGQSKHGAFTV